MERQFGAFTASEIFCPKCQQAQPVRERLLLVLPAGELHEYLCAQCATSVGQRTITASPPQSNRQCVPLRGKPRHLAG